MGAIASQITSFTSVYLTVYADADQRKHQCSASLAFVRGIHRGPVNSPHKWPVTRKMFPFDDVIMWWKCTVFLLNHEETIQQNMNLLQQLWWHDSSHLITMRPSAAYMRQWPGSALVQIMACRLFGAMPLSELMLACCQLDSWEQISVKCKWEFYHFHSRKCIWNCRLPKWWPFCPGEMI